jgi:pyruvate/2-oxoglutarate dehydrogenase complex dihydrolipoamide dehydrogenase (E3) component
VSPELCTSDPCFVPFWILSSRIWCSESRNCNRMMPNSNRWPLGYSGRLHGIFPSDPGRRLEAAGLAADSRGRLKVNEFFQTELPHIYAAGDVIGVPALASTSMEQGRLAASHMFQIPFEHMPALFPYGIYTIPEVCMVGQTEETLTSNRVPYEVGIAKYSELAKSMMLGDEARVLKLLFDPQTHKLLGVHALGQRATEIIHIGQDSSIMEGRRNTSATWSSTIRRSLKPTK